MRPEEGSGGVVLPRHVAIIMDGNGRWARQQGLPRTEGHQRGAKAVREVVVCARELGISFLTLYAFSVENWGRPVAEVSTLMSLLQEFLFSELPLMLKHGIRLRVIGETSTMPAAVQGVLASTLAATEKNTDMTLTLALSYAGRNEIVRAVRKVASAAAQGKINPADVTEETFSGYLDTSYMPDPDLVIRTSGEVRISNFLPWQSAYAEFVFTDVLWPDFGKAEFILALEEFSRRNRRFGLTDEQLRPQGAK